ncbi:MAG: glycosyltransferase family 2 protein [Gammaproteobacteria bacterium]|nr:glycosyltransferase family 2 protein [Gammaproteobacteria bacterium]
MKLSIVLPAKNEETGLSALLLRVVEFYPDAEVIVVDDGSSDATAAVAAGHGARVVSHPYSMGNGAAIKAGARAARGEVLVFMDADGQHDPADIACLLAKLDEGFDMAVGARAAGTHASTGRRMANYFYNRVATYMTGHPISDLTSGFRAVRAHLFKRFLYLLPNGFSYPTTITMAFFRAGHSVGYVPIKAGRREGKSNIKLLHDGVKFFVIILKIGSLFSPMRLFLPISFVFFGLGLVYYGYTFFTMGRFTNMGALLFISSLLIFLIGIISEQISSLHYKNVEQDRVK